MAQICPSLESFTGYSLSGIPWSEKNRGWRVGSQVVAFIDPYGTTIYSFWILETRTCQCICVREKLLVNENHN
ncbi:hypothetical protein XELAEV_18018985mg [Xenopus laevis]|uniref:Uncharacterized protein n=1 Tax=Xenopus laevis TaxID=8355 RepID=A0A974DES4_XENLA|nr:hypothetical protein XELAEV_18018985mg [Xenopus laevis]